MTAPINTGAVCGRTISNSRAQAMAIIAWCGKSGERNPASWVWDRGWWGIGEGRLLYNDCREREGTDDGMSDEDEGFEEWGCLSMPWCERRCCMWESNPA
jgi:hypothetical protein